MLQCRCSCGPAFGYRADPRAAPGACGQCAPPPPGGSSRSSAAVAGRRREGIYTDLLSIELSHGHRLVPGALSTLVHTEPTKAPRHHPGLWLVVATLVVAFHALVVSGVSVPAAGGAELRGRSRCGRGPARFGSRTGGSVVGIPPFVRPTQSSDDKPLCRIKIQVELKLPGIGCVGEMLSRDHTSTAELRSAHGVAAAATGSAAGRAVGAWIVHRDLASRTDRYTGHRG